MNYRHLIEAQIPHEPKTTEYIAAYQGAVTKVIKNLDDDLQETVENLVEEWNKEGAPPELQLK
jgi:hypothetical protein